MTPLPSIDAVVVREVRIPLRRAYRTHSTALGDRRLLLVAVRAGDLIGWGECGPVPGYSTETLDDCRPALRGAARRLLAGETVDPSAPPSVRFAIDSALADLRGRREGVPCWSALGGVAPTVEIGAVLGLDRDGDDLADAARRLEAAGYRRLKLKVAPGRCEDRTRRVREALPDRVLAVDANGSFMPDDDAELRRIDDLGLAFIEQPYPAGAGRLAVDLASMLATPVCLDESISDLRHVAAAIDEGVPWVFNIKPARLGGIEAAVLATAMAASSAIPVWCGSMLESGVGKAAALAAATLPGMAMASELSPSDRHFDTDLVEWVMESGAMRPPDAPGLGIEIDQEALGRFTHGTERFGDGF